MVGIVNPSGNKTLSDYKSRASKLSGGVNPGNATFGGELANKDNSSKDSSDTKNGDKGGQGNKTSGQDDKKGNKDDKTNAAGMLEVSTGALAGVLGAALYML